MTPIKETLNELLNKNEPLLDQAKRLFPDHPKAQDVWIKLGTSGAGGVIETVNVIGLRKDYRDYADKYIKLNELEQYASADELLAQFIKFCQKQVLDNYHKFV